LVLLNILLLQAEAVAVTTLVAVAVQVDTVQAYSR
jgi:hypothetical protein